MLTFLLYILLMISFCTNLLYPMQGVNRILTSFKNFEHVSVYMNHSNRVVLNAQDNTSHVISTGDLRGCTVAVIYLKNKNKQYTIMTHFQPMKLIEHSAILREEIRPVSNEYDYAHGMIIYFNGKSFLSKDTERIECYKTSEYIQGYLYKAAEISKKTCSKLSEEIQKQLSVKKLVLTHIPYVLAPTLAHKHGLIFQGESAEVSVILSNDENTPSYCAINDAYCPIICCDTRLGKSIAYEKSAQDRSLLMGICARQAE